MVLANDVNSSTSLDFGLLTDKFDIPLIIEPVLPEKDDSHEVKMLTSSSLSLDSTIIKGPLSIIKSGPSDAICSRCSELEEETVEVVEVTDIDDEPPSLTGYSLCLILKLGYGVSKVTKPVRSITLYFSLSERPIFV